MEALIIGIVNVAVNILKQVNETHQTTMKQ